MKIRFDPLDYICEAAHGEVAEWDGIPEVPQTAVLRPLQDIVDQVRVHLRQAYGRKMAVAVIDPEMRREMERQILQYVSEEGLRIPGVPQKRLLAWIQQEILYFGPIQMALDDPDVSNIDINRFCEVNLERLGEEEYHPEMCFKDEAHLEVIINKMLMADGKALTANEPHIDSLFEKYRICAVLGTARGGIATEGTCASIRKFSDDTMSPEDLVRSGTMSPEMDEFFRQVLPSCNCIIAGATNSGKTTTLMALPLYFDAGTRIITIEDSPEMMLRRRSRYRDYHNIVALQTKDHDNKEKRYDIAKLTKVSLRMRPVKILIGEVRDAQACRQAHEGMNTGHSTYFTIHASSARNAAVRVVQLAGDGSNDEVIASQLADTVDLIIFQQKRRKSRIISEVAELIGFEGARRPLCRTLFQFEQQGMTPEGYVTGIHRRINGISEILADKLMQALVPDQQILRWAGPPVLNEEAGEGLGGETKWCL